MEYMDVVNFCAAMDTLIDQADPNPLPLNDVIQVQVLFFISINVIVLHG